MNSLIRALGLLAIALVLSGCTQSACRPGPYLEAKAPPPLVIPEGMDAPDRQMALRVPGRQVASGRPGREPDGCAFEPPAFYAEIDQSNPQGLPIRPSAMPGAVAAERAAPPRLLREVTAFIEDWAEAWGKRDFRAWVRFYAPEFHPAGYESQATWRAEQERLFEVEASTRIDSDSVRVTILEEGRVRARFEQHFGLRGDERTVLKELVLKPGSRRGRWLIAEDYVLEVR